MKHKDGTLRWILSKAQALRTSDGKAIRMAGSHSDITSRKQFEEKLANQKAYIESLLMAIPDLMFILNAEGNFLGLKAGHSQSLYLPKEQFIGKNVSEVLPEKLSKSLQIMIDKTIQGKPVQPLRYQLPINEEMKDLNVGLL